MKVTFKKPQKLGNKQYPAGTQEVPDMLAHSLAFQGLVKSLGVHVHPRDNAAQAIQAQRDATARARAGHINLQAQAELEKAKAVQAAADAKAAKVKSEE